MLKFIKFLKTNIFFIFIGIYFGLISANLAMRIPKFSKLNLSLGVKTLLSLYFLGILITIYFKQKKSYEIKNYFTKILFALLPAKIILFLIFYQTNFFNQKIIYQPFKILLTGYLLILGLFWIFKIQKYQTVKTFLAEIFPFLFKKNIFKTDNAETSFLENENKKNKLKKSNNSSNLAKSSTKEKKTTSKNSFSNLIFKKYLVSIILFLTVALNLLFSFYHLGKSAAVDEPLWTSAKGRVPKFWSNVGDGELWKTTVSDKPGITTAIISGFGLIFINKEDLSPKASTTNSDPEKVNFAFRFPLVIFNALMLPIFYFLLKKLLGKFPALISIILISLSPIIIGISTIVNPDASLWIFLPFSLFCFLIYLKNNFSKLNSPFLTLSNQNQAINFNNTSLPLSNSLNNTPSISHSNSNQGNQANLNITKENPTNFLYWSGIFLGLAILTKYVANILYLFYFFLFLLHFLINKKNFDNENISLKQYLKIIFKDFAVLILFSLFSFTLFLPEAWVDLNKVLESTLLSKAFAAIWKIIFGDSKILFGIITFLILAVIDIYFLKKSFIEKTIDFLSHFKKIIILSVYLIFLICILATLANVYLGMKFYNFEEIIASPKSSFGGTDFIGMTLANFFSLIFGILPLALTGILFYLSREIFIQTKSWHLKNKKISSTSEKEINKESLVKETFQNKNNSQIKNVDLKKLENFHPPKLFTNFTFFYLTIFILIYYLASTVSDVSATVRYQVTIFPLAFTLAGIGLNDFIKTFQQKSAFFLQTFLAPSFLITLIIFCVYSLNFIRPFYFSYASNLLPNRYTLNLKDMGDGSFEAAQYLNSLPNAENLVVWTDKNGVCAFLKSQSCYNDVVIEKGKKVFDYLVVSAGRKARTTNMLKKKSHKIKFNLLYDMDNPVFKLKIGNRENNFVKIFKADKTNLEQ